MFMIMHSFKTLSNVPTWDMLKRIVEAKQVFWDIAKRERNKNKSVGVGYA